MDQLSILRNYYLGKRPFYGKTTVVPGLYYISTILPNQPEKAFLVKAYWNPTEPVFLSEPSFVINLSPLYNFGSESLHKVIPVDHLLHAVIKITHVSLEDSTFENEPCKAYKIVWELLDYAEECSVVQAVSPITTEQAPLFTDSSSADEDESIDEDALIVLKEIEQMEEEELLQLLYDEEQQNLQNTGIDNELLQLLYDDEIREDRKEDIDNELLQLLYDEEVRKEQGPGEDEPSTED
jgi:hypothetical protein